MLNLIDFLGMPNDKDREEALGSVLVDVTLEGFRNGRAWPGSIHPTKINNQSFSPSELTNIINVKNTDELHEEERQLIQMIQAIQENCIKQQKPFLDRLVSIRNCRVPRYLFDPATNEIKRLD